MSVLDDRARVAVRKDRADREVHAAHIGLADRDAPVLAGGDVDARVLVVERADERGRNDDGGVLATSHCESPLIGRLIGKDYGIPARDASPF